MSSSLPLESKVLRIWLNRENFQVNLVYKENSLTLNVYSKNLTKNAKEKKKHCHDYEVFCVYFLELLILSSFNLV